MERKSVSGEELERALSEGTMDPANVGFVVGLVKNGDSEGEVQFSQIGCTEWISVPTKMIRSARAVGTASCGGTRYPLILIEFTPTKDPFAIVAYKLLSQLHTATKGGGSSLGGEAALKGDCGCSEKSSGGTSMPASLMSAGNLRPSFGIGGLGRLGAGVIECTIDFECSPCTRCIPWTGPCWSSTCCDIVGGSCTGGT